MDINQLVSKNQSIKIVPSVEDSLRNIGLNVDLNENSKLWFEQLKITWKTWKKSATVESHIVTFFQSIVDPYRVALVFIIKCEEFKDCKPKSLPYFIIETLQKWSQMNQRYPDDALKLPAFHIAIQQRNQNFLNLIVKTYQITTIKELILPIVKEMIKNDNCKHASQIVIAMELIDSIPVEDLLFPLILQDKANMIDEYLTECPSQVKPLLLFLDKLLDKNRSIREYVQNFVEENKVCNIKYDKIHYKPLGKLVARLCNKFKVPIEFCKNLSKNRTTGGLRYLIYQKYVENNVSASVWDDLVKDSLKQNIGSAKEFIDMLIDYDRKEAYKWATYLNLPKNELPLPLQETSIEDAPVEEVVENWDIDQNDSQEYYKLSLSDDQIILIDSAEKFYDLMISDLVKCNIVSIDCEWKPSFGATQSQVALIQIATTHKVYLIDTMILNDQNYNSFWYTFNKSLVDNAEIIKLGFGLEQDLKEMKASVSGLGNIKLKGEGLLDLCLLWKSLLGSGIILPSNSDSGRNSLSCLVQSCFGLPLEKSEQCSNWELRPLRSTQIKYAALDAHVLIEIYYYLQKICTEQNINFEEICNNVMLEGKNKCPKKKVCDKLISQSSSPQKQNSLPNFESQPVKDVRFLVEPEVSNLMVYLRYCGIDTTVMPTSMMWSDVINLAISDSRLILVSKTKGTPTSNYPQKFILGVGKGSIRDKIQKVLCHFNIVIKQSDLMSRCINCNDIDLKKLDPNEVHDICNNYRSTSIQVNSYRADYEEEEDTNLDNFLTDSEDDDLCQPVHNQNELKKCVTSYGVPIEIDDIQNLLMKHKTALLCERCGKLFWDEDKLYRSVSDVISKVTKLNIG